ncbi:hypothetical protein ANN_27114 [Periplaneta americana]|uniref:Uncharacterized protein n=1 Tax=Periplaneta americana TaxID=6978 RepID=A0ABQ8RXP1_PERAM|nr:hypothetical protein ANN_27114 [Periplaneta americana]
MFILYELARAAWDRLKAAIRQRNPLVKTVQDLREATVGPSRSTGKAKECEARAITREDHKGIIVVKGVKKSQHSHLPNREEAGSIKVKENLKSLAEERPEMTLAQILRNELRDVLSAILA